MADSSTTSTSRSQADPSVQRLGRVYALAYLDAAQSMGESQPLEEFDSFITDVLAQHPDFEQILTSEVTSRDDKVAILGRVASSASPFFANFLQVLAKHERLGILRPILEQARLEWEQRQGQQRVGVTSAVPLSSEQTSQIQERLRSALKREPIVTAKTDSDLLGGLVIQVGDTIYDGSLRTRLRDLKQRMRQRYLHEIQSGRDRFSHPEGN